MIFPKQTMQCSGRLLDLSSPLIMGILNITPDSFYTASRQQEVNTAVAAAGDMLAHGAAILDIGGMSSRPGAKIITPQQELKRILPVIDAIISRYPNSILSVDTVHAEVAREAVAAGVAMINDISAGKIDPEMYKTVAELAVPYILMHAPDIPEHMQQSTHYDDVTKEVLNFLIKEVHQLKILGVKDIIIDPGFGFGKTIDQNYTLLQQLHLFKMLDYPILAGISRKSMIYKFLGIPPEEALSATTALHMIALQQGAKILRVHDVKAAREVVQLWQKAGS